VAPWSVIGKFERRRNPLRSVEEKKGKRLHMASLLHVSVASLGCHVIRQIISSANVSQIF